jgi:hypothetical protein
MFVRITKAPGGVEYVHTVEGYRDEHGKSKQRIVASHGKLADLLAVDPDGLVKLKEQAAAGNDARSVGKGVIAYDTSTPWDGGVAQNVGWLLVDAVLSRLGAPVVMGRGTPGEVLRLLVCSRVVWPGSKIKAWERREQLFAGPRVTDWHEVYEGLDVICDKAPVLQQMAAASLHRTEEQWATVDYDVTNYFFAIDHDDPDPVGKDGARGQASRQRGHCKESRPSPIIQMGLFTDADGIPIGYRLFDGNVPDVSTLAVALPQFRAMFHPGRIVVVGDKAMNTTTNLGMLHQQGDGWIVSTSVRSGKKEFQDWATDPTGWTTTSRAADGTITSKIKSRLVTTTLPHEDYGIKGLPVAVTERQIVRWSADSAARDGANRADMLTKAARLAADPARLKASKHRGVRKYIIEDHVDPATGEIRADTTVAHLDQDRAIAEARFDGYQGLRTSETDLPETQIIDRYRQLWRIEETFKVSKTGGLDTRPVYVRTRTHIEAHFAICFLALLITRLLEHWTGLPAPRLLTALRAATATPAAPGVYRMQRTTDWPAIDTATGVPLDQSWARISQLRDWHRDLTKTAKTTQYTTQK